MDQSTSRPPSRINHALTDRVNPALTNPPTLHSSVLLQFELDILLQRSAILL
jgi:hypothetical protein